MFNHTHIWAIKYQPERKNISLSLSGVSEVNAARESQRNVQSEIYYLMDTNFQAHQCGTVLLIKDMPNIQSRKMFLFSITTHLVVILDAHQSWTPL